MGFGGFSISSDSFIISQPEEILFLSEWGSILWLRNIFTRYLYGGWKHQDHMWLAWNVVSRRYSLVPEICQLLPMIYLRLQPYICIVNLYVMDHK